MILEPGGVPEPQHGKLVPDRHVDSWGAVPKPFPGVPGGRLEWERRRPDPEEDSCPTLGGGGETAEVGALGWRGSPGLGVSPVLAQRWRVLGLTQQHRGRNKPTDVSELSCRSTSPGNRQDLPHPCALDRAPYPSQRRGAGPGPAGSGIRRTCLGLGVCRTGPAWRPPPACGGPAAPAERDGARPGPACPAHQRATSSFLLGRNQTLDPTQESLVLSGQCVTRRGGGSRLLRPLRAARLHRSPSVQTDATLPSVKLSLCYNFAERD